MVRYTLKQCYYFRAVATHGGIAQAARKLSISQPAIAQAIDKLEDITGLCLFERRHAKGLILTDQGDAFLAQAEHLLQVAEATEKEIADIKAHQSGTIRIGCFQSIAPFYVARLIRRYHGIQPGITLDIRETLQGDIISDLISKDLDLAILYDLNLDPERLEWHILGRHKPYILLSATHPLAAQKKISLRSLAAEGYVLFDAPNSREYFYSVFASLQINPKVSFRATSFESVRSAVGHGLGFSLMAMRSPHSNTYDGQAVVAVEIEEDIAPITVVLAHKLGEPLGPIAQRFKAFVEAEFDKEL
ncbi:LysR family transcriptional regulator [Sneathiella aquimaris]|uniref:LysR family transcriptional regulator n=1 Tax=Sneathiella aquimaris TaxID=2599305 RepID=UPI00146B8CDF|nr:LysR family transcriptional regulator [Sneathiella aquimaris]